MTVIVTPGFKTTALSLVSPNLFSGVGAQKLVWQTAAGNVQPQGMPHFHVQIATDSAFTSVVEEAQSWNDAMRFEYENYPGVWEPLTTPLLGVSLTWPGSQAAYNTNLDNYITLIGATPHHVQMVRDMSSSMFSTTQMDALEARGCIPMISAEPWAGTNPDPTYKLTQITAGVFDSFFTTGANTAKTWKGGKTILLRWAPEMNGTWENWGPGTHGTGGTAFTNTATDFINAWQHVYNIFQSVGATNVKFIWCPNVYPPGGGSAQPFAAFYPGDNFVHLLGLDGYNFGALDIWQTWSQVFGYSYDQMLTTVSSNKPIMVCETASNENGGDKAAWITSAYLNEIPQRTPRIRYVTWFNVDKSAVPGETDWRVESSTASLNAYRNVENVIRKTSVGLAISDIGKNVRYNSVTSANGTYYWRARVVEFM